MNEVKQQMESPLIEIVIHYLGYVGMELMLVRSLRAQDFRQIAPSNSQSSLIK